MISVVPYLFKKMIARRAAKRIHDRVTKLTKKPRSMKSGIELNRKSSGLQKDMNISATAKMTHWAWMYFFRARDPYMLIQLITLCCLFLILFSIKIKPFR